MPRAVYSYVVCKLAPNKTRTDMHPIAFDVETHGRAVQMIPTLHVHGKSGNIPDKVSDWDHVIFHLGTGKRSETPKFGYENETDNSFESIPDYRQFLSSVNAVLFTDRPAKTISSRLYDPKKTSPKKDTALSPSSKSKTMGAKTSIPSRRQSTGTVTEGTSVEKVTENFAYVQSSFPALTKVAAAMPSLPAPTSVRLLHLRGTHPNRDVVIRHRMAASASVVATTASASPVAASASPPTEAGPVSSTSSVAVPAAS